MYTENRIDSDSDIILYMYIYLNKKKIFLIIMLKAC